jgi:hypothetical protein
MAFETRFGRVQIFGNGVTFYVPDIRHVRGSQASCAGRQVRQGGVRPCAPDCPAAMTAEAVCGASMTSDVRPAHGADMTAAADTAAASAATASVSAGCQRAASAPLSNRSAALFNMVLLPLCLAKAIRSFALAICANRVNCSRPVRSASNHRPTNSDCHRNRHGARTKRICRPERRQTRTVDPRSRTQSRDKAGCD